MSLTSPPAAAFQVINREPIARAYNLGGSPPLDQDFAAWAATVPNNPMPIKASVRFLTDFFGKLSLGLRLAPPNVGF